MEYPVLRGSMQLPKKLVNLPSVIKQLTVKYTPMGEEEALEVCAYKLTDSAIHVPRQFGIALCDSMGLKWEDDTSAGHVTSFPKTPKPRPEQVEPLKLIQESLEGYYDFIFRARTGWGKTIGSLIAASKLGTSVLVLVDQENLKDQWVSSLVTHFGFAAADVGIIQGDKCSYKGKAVTIGMVQTLSQRTFPQEVYDYFGALIVDEVHIIGAPTFSKVLFDFSATNRFGVSATPKRRDTLQKLLGFHLGEVRVYVDDEHDASAVYIVEHPTVYTEYANRAPKIGRFVTEISEDASRNLLVAESAGYLFDTGRANLVLSDRIEQLRHIESLLYYLGVPEELVGVYTGMYPAYEYDKDPTPKRRPENLIKYDGTEGYFSETPEGSAEWTAGYYYTPIVLTLISKKRRKDTLEQIKTGAQIILATYGKFSKGVDEPRLSGGVDASPRSEAEQVQGRILRKVEGKLRPIWITIKDTNSYRSVFSLARRIEAYLKNNSRISFWDIERGKTPCQETELRNDLLDEVNQLKSMRIATNSDGLNTMQTLEKQMRSAVQVVRRTAPVSRSSPTVCIAKVRLRK